MTTLIAPTHMMDSHKQAVASERKCLGLSPVTDAAVVQSIIAFPDDERTLEKIWEEPTPDEWRRALRIIAKQALMHIAGYVYDDEFARGRPICVWIVSRSVGWARLPDYISAKNKTARRPSGRAASWCPDRVGSLCGAKGIFGLAHSGRK